MLQAIGRYDVILPWVDRHRQLRAYGNPKRISEWRIAEGEALMAGQVGSACGHAEPGGEASAQYALGVGPPRKGKEAGRKVGRRQGPKLPAYDFARGCDFLYTSSSCAAFTCVYRCVVLWRAWPRSS